MDNLILIQKAQELISKWEIEEIQARARITGVLTYMGELDKIRVGGGSDNLEQDDGSSEQYLSDEDKEEAAAENGP